MVEWGICRIRERGGQSARLRRVKRARERACAPSTPVVSTNPSLGRSGRVSKSLAFFSSSVTLTRLQRRNFSPRT